MFENYADMVSLDDMCAMLRIGKNKAYELLRNGSVGGFKEGRIWKIPKIVIEEYIKEHRK